jgi:hypothetical protein
MSKRSEFNIGETQKTSVKVVNAPGGQSNWSIGWEENKPLDETKKQNTNG